MAATVHTTPHNYNICTANKMILMQAGRHSCSVNKMHKLFCEGVMSSVVILEEPWLDCFLLSVSLLPLLSHPPASPKPLAPCLLHQLWPRGGGGKGEGGRRRRERGRREEEEKGKGREGRREGGAQ